MWGSTQLAEHLAQRDRHIDLALLVDPVTRYYVLKPLSMGWWGRNRVTYRVHRNVDEVFSWLQVNHQGQYDPATDPGVDIADAILLGRWWLMQLEGQG